MLTKNLLISLITVASLFMYQDAQACRGPFPKPISSEEAFDRAEAVFLGKVIEIKEGFPADFKPSDSKEYNERLQNLKRQNIGNGEIGRTIIFEPIKTWKNGKPGSTTIIVESYKQDSCEWNYDVQKNDEFIIFASRYGNYLTFPAIMFDGRSGYTKHNPAKRVYSDYQKEHYAESIKNDAERIRSHFKYFTASINSQIRFEVFPRWCTIDNGVLCEG